MQRNVIFILAMLLSKFLGSGAITPRGVQPELASFYNPGRSFQCLDGSNTISFQMVNDDYCDCLDGSDEPGTSACVNGRFSCLNYGHISRVIPSSRVNDGICDCCDGTDEWADDSHGICQNVCLELGEAARLEAKRLNELQEAGFALRKVMIAESIEIRKAMENDLKLKEEAVLQAEKIRDEKQAMKEEAEIPESIALKVYEEQELEKARIKEEEELALKAAQAKEVFNIIDSNQDGYVTPLEIEAHLVFDQDKDGIVNDMEIKFFMSDHEHYDVEQFISVGWTLMSPYWNAKEDENETLQTNGENVPAEDEEGEADMNDDHVDDGDYDDKDYENPTGLDDKLPPPFTDGHEKVDELGFRHEFAKRRRPLREHHATTTETTHQYDKYDPETRKLVEAADAARNSLTEAISSLKNAQDMVSELKNFLQSDLGPDSVFIGMNGKCYEHKQDDYIYKLCPFDRCWQGSVSLGVWGEWAGPSHDRYSVMRFTGGQACWNGPDRTTIVHIQCGLEDKLVTVSEPSRCEYVFNFQTPAVCMQPSVNYESKDYVDYDLQLQHSEL